MKKILIIFGIVFLLISIVSAVLKIDDIKDNKEYEEYKGLKLKEVYGDKLVYSTTVCWEYKDNDPTKSCIDERVRNFIYSEQIFTKYTCSIIPLFTSYCDYLSSDEKTCYLNNEPHQCYVGKWYESETDYEKLKIKE